MKGCMCQQFGKTGVPNARGFCLVCGELVDPAGRVPQVPPYKVRKALREKTLAVGRRKPR